MNRSLKNILAHLRSSNSPLGFMARFLLTYLLLLGFYKLYLAYTSYTYRLDWVTYSISELSYYLAQALGVTNCTFSCFMEGCLIGEVGKEINVVEGCNGLSLAIAYGAFIIAFSRLSKATVLQAFIGLIVIQGFNVLRIGILIALRDFGGDAYFYFVKYLFGTVIYAAIIALWSLQSTFEKLLHPSQIEK